MSKLYVGLMSGTSLDAVDAVLVQFEPHFELAAHYSHSLDPGLRQRILRLTQPGQDGIDALGALDVELGELFAQCVLELLRTNDVPSRDVAAIGSHGQTLRHRPQLGFTLQAGDPTRIAEATGITTIADFRRRDIAAGGQGAPLVPAFHHALFSHLIEDRVIVNIGGMANLTCLPHADSQPVSGFDTGPGNVLMDSWISRIQGLSYDTHGSWAASGTVIPALLEAMLAEPFFSLTPPKSTGRELFNLHWLDALLAQFGQTPAPADVQATLLELTARSISDAIRLTALNTPALYLCGGGAHNIQLQRRLQQLNPGSRVSTTDSLGLPGDWVEAAAFAWLAWRTLQQRSGNLPAVTGARGERILGAIHLA